MKKAVNLSLDADLVAEARALGINFSQRLEESLQEAVRSAREEAWIEANRGAMADYNARIAKTGSFGDRNKVW